MALLKKIKTELYSFVLSQKDGIAANKLDSAYDGIFGYPHEEMKQLGLRSLVQVADAHEHIRNGFRSGVPTYTAIPTEETALLLNVIKNQCSAKRKSTKKRRGTQKFNSTFSSFDRSRSFSTPNSLHSKPIFRQPLPPSTNFHRKPQNPPRPLQSVTESDSRLKAKKTSQLKQLVTKNVMELLIKIYPEKIKVTNLTELYQQKYNILLNPNIEFQTSWVGLYQDCFDNRRVGFNGLEFFLQKRYAEFLGIEKFDQPENPPILTLNTTVDVKKQGKLDESSQSNSSRRRLTGPSLIKDLVNKSKTHNEKLDMNRELFARTHAKMYSDSMDINKKKQPPIGRRQTRCDMPWVHDKFEKLSTTLPTGRRNSSKESLLDEQDDEYQSFRKFRVFAPTENSIKVVLEMEKSDSEADGKCVVTNPSLPSASPTQTLTSPSVSSVLSDSAKSYYKIGTVNSGQISTLVMDDSLVAKEATPPRVGSQVSATTSGDSSEIVKSAISQAYYKIEFTGKYKKEIDSISKTLSNVQLDEAKTDLLLAQECALDDDWD